MTEPDDCRVARDLAPEVAIGVASAEDRARMLEHVLNCPDCRTLLVELSTVVDDIVALAPRLEPPGGFESDILARLHPTTPAAAGPRTSRRFRLRRLALAAAAVVVAAGVTGTVVYRIGAEDRTLADQVRSTLATADGEYFAAAPLLDSASQRRGVLFGYQGHPPWMFLVVERAESDERFTIEYVTHQGSIHTLGEEVALSVASPWGAVLPVAVHDIAAIRVLDSQGELVLSAQLVP